ncbi:MAG: hypothetical protein JWP03_4352, partial [Phycisphaerales bacterium]|nr:hypothetical protein [Phycisphaerales bacterium]
FGLTIGQTGYVPYFHFNGNYSTATASKISNADFGQFSNRFPFAGFVYVPGL